MAWRKFHLFYHQILYGDNRAGFYCWYEWHTGTHYTVDASLEETIDFFLETRDSLYNYSDEEMRKEFYPIASIDSIRKSIQNGVVNSSTLGFFRSFVLARRFEWTILSESNFGWRNTTPIVVRLNPLYTWTYNIFDQEGSRYWCVSCRSVFTCDKYRCIIRYNYC